MASQPETLLVKKIKKKILQHYPNAWILKVAGGAYQTVGVPDLIVVINGQAFGFEVKKQRHNETREQAIKRTTILQWHQINEMRKAGAVAEVILHEDEVVPLILTAITGKKR